MLETWRQAQPTAQMQQPRLLQQQPQARVRYVGSVYPRVPKG